jgi:hypothetical protein
LTVTVMVTPSLSLVFPALPCVHLLALACVHLLALALSAGTFVTTA